MTTLLLLLALLAIATLWRMLAGKRRERRRWKLEAERIAAMHETLAREATRPNGHVDQLARHDGSRRA